MAPTLAGLIIGLQLIVIGLLMISKYNLQNQLYDLHQQHKAELDALLSDPDRLLDMLVERGTREIDEIVRRGEF